MIVATTLSLALAAQAATPSPKGATAPKAAPAAKAAAKTLSFQPKTLVDGETLQVVLGQRAVFTIGDNGRPFLEKVEEGKLAEAHAPGKATETFNAPGEGLVAAALDGSAEKRATFLKVWNDRSEPLDFRAIVLVLKGKDLAPMPVNICAVPPGGVKSYSWPAPIVAVGLARFTAKPNDDATCK
ncbi:hypothetical protein [Phenylobacterium sp. J367]|uniref:hypothetical protein n=1 Tax=Phenylobacterium sp. J367 TaxID=2898435 RepID=UPI00215128C6|nr:hypothetical protein [Phenylobacterium sp. J367]MCR5879040.1 hypothetical protein [Phenylobacterium sp. J367]